MALCGMSLVDLVGFLSAQFTNTCRTSAPVSRPTEQMATGKYGARKSLLTPFGGFS